MNRWWCFVLVLIVLVATACDEPDPAPRTSRNVPAAPAPADGMCEHDVPEALCTKCDPALAAVFQAKGDWCEAHGFPESFCPICNPDAKFPEFDAPAAGATGDWCVEHGLPESKCTKCHPSLVAEYQAAGDWCVEHGFPESVCPICSPQTPPAGAEQAAIEARIVRFRSPDIEATAGIGTVTAQRSEAAASSVECTARLAFHGDRIADIHAIVPGIVRDVQVELGDRVESGAALFELESTRVGEIQAELQTAREKVRTAKANVARKRELRESDIASARQLDLAEQELATAQTEVSSAQAALRMIGAPQSGPAGRYTLNTPIAGVVVRRPTVLGILATEDTSLATIADTSVMWALCDVLESNAAQIVVGQALHLTIDGDAESSFEGQITWIAAEVDPRTRTVTAHAEVPNPAGKLRANQFGRARIDTSSAAVAVSVPRAAVQRVGALDVVFVRTGEGVYEPRVVRRHGDGEMVSVEGRVSEGDAVVTTGAVLLRTEIMPGSLGAGCCEVQ